MKKKKKRGEGDFLDEGRPYVTKIFAKFSHDAPLPVVKKKHLTIEQLNARRRKVWLTIAKKEIPKVSMHDPDKQACAQEFLLKHPVTNYCVYIHFAVFQAEDVC